MCASSLQKAKNSAEALRLFPNEVEEIQRLDSQIRGGSTAVLAVLEAGRVLRVANVGDSRALLCYLSEAGQLRTEQLSVDHTTCNEEELVRLAGLGLDRDGLRRSARLGMHQNTRSLGDYSIKGGYKDHDVIRYFPYLFAAACSRLCFVPQSRLLAAWLRRALHWPPAGRVSSAGVSGAHV